MLGPGWIHLVSAAGSRSTAQEMNCGTGELGHLILGQAPHVAPNAQRNVRL